MQMPVFFFEISGNVISLEIMYRLCIILGVSGFLLGFWRWWLSAIWLIFPLIFALILFININYDYDARIFQFGKSYILHSYFSAIIGIGLNLIGIFIRFFKNKKKLQ